MHAHVELFVLPPDGGTAMPEPGERREVEAATTDGLKAAAAAALAEEGYRVRAVSFTPDGLVAYVEASS